MNALIVNIIAIFLLILLVYISFQAGIIRTLFAVAAGFFAVILAENYPYQYGINYYLIFFVSAFGIFLVGIFVFKILKFLCLSFFDKIAGAVLGLCLWFIISANFLVPVLTHEIKNTENNVMNSFTNVIRKQIPVFDEYIPNFILDKRLKNSQNYILLSNKRG